MVERSCQLLSETLAQGAALWWEDLLFLACHLDWIFIGAERNFLHLKLQEDVVGEEVKPGPRWVSRSTFDSIAAAERVLGLTSEAQKQSCKMSWIMRIYSCERSGQK